MRGVFWNVLLRVSLDRTWSVLRQRRGEGRVWGGRDGYVSCHHGWVCSMIEWAFMEGLSYGPVVECNQEHFFRVNTSTSLLLLPRIPPPRRSHKNDIRYISVPACWKVFVEFFPNTPERLLIIAALKALYCSPLQRKGFYLILLQLPDSFSYKWLLYRFS